jgi:hypothetical protein
VKKELDGGEGCDEGIGWEVWKKVLKGWKGREKVFRMVGRTKRRNC